MIAATSMTFVACQQKSAKDAVEPQKLVEEAIRIHDEIMPQIAHFDRTTVTIDSLLLTNIDEQQKTDLTTLKSNLENATDNMMTWMKEYNSDSTDVAYQKAEIEKVKTMKKQFDDVSLESNKKLGAL